MRKVNEKGERQRGQQWRNGLNEGRGEGRNLISILKEHSCQWSKLITALYLYQPPQLRMTRYGSMMCVCIRPTATAQ